MRVRLRLFCPSCVLVIASGIAESVSLAQDMRRPMKLIATGWDKADTGWLREHLAEMEKRPFDGVVLEVAGQDEDGKRVPLPWGFQNATWRREWFQAGIDDLRACKIGRVRETHHMAVCRFSFLGHGQFRRRLDFATYEGNYPLQIP